MLGDRLWSLRIPSGLKLDKQTAAVGAYLGGGTMERGDSWPVSKRLNQLQRSEHLAHLLRGVSAQRIFYIIMVL